MDVWLLGIMGYLLGSIPTGKLLGHAYGVDIQRHGSGNIGFANAVRVLGWKPAVLVLLGDAGKSLVSVLLAKQVLMLPVYQVCVVAIVTILGNIYPLWLRFKGGKGIATGLGATLAISPLLAVIGVAMYVLVVSMVRRSARASIIGTWSLPFCALAIAPAYAPLYFGLGLLALWTHRANLRKMLGRTVVYDD